MTGGCGGSVLREGSRGGIFGGVGSTGFDKAEGSGNLLSGSRVPLKLRCIEPQSEPRPILERLGGGCIGGAVGAPFMPPSCFFSAPFTPSLFIPFVRGTIGGSSHIFSTTLVRRKAQSEHVARSRERHQPVQQSG